MKKQIISFTLLAVGFIAGASVLSALAAGTWTAPAGAPPTLNVDAPINVGSSAQIKTGLLSLGNFQFLPAGTSSVIPGSVLTSDSAGYASWSPMQVPRSTPVIYGYVGTEKPNLTAGGIDITKLTPGLGASLGEHTYCSTAGESNGQAGSWITFNGSWTLNSQGQNEYRQVICFDLTSPLTYNVIVHGIGTVETLGSAGPNCEGTTAGGTTICSRTLQSPQNVGLKASPATKFVNWGGDTTCTTNAICNNIQMYNLGMNIVANFNP